MKNMFKIFSKIKEVIFKIKNYDHLEKDYSTVIDRTTCSMLNKTDCNVDTILDVINNQQKLKYAVLFLTEKNLWIDVNEDLPFKHREFLFVDIDRTVNVFCMTDIGYTYIDRMAYNKREKKWEWMWNRDICAWMPIPKYKGCEF